MSMSTAEYDYTREDVMTEDGSDDFSFGGVSYNKTADQIEAERVRRDVPPGDHEFVVSGFLKAPKMASKQGYVDGKAVSYNVYELGVRLSMADDPAASVIDFFHLPTENDRDQHCFMNVSKNVDGKNAGFMAEKLGFFLDRLGFKAAKGQPIPVEAQNIRNWKGRKIVATIELQEQKDQFGNPKNNPNTGEPYPPKPSVKLFSYRPHASSLGGSSHPSQSRPSQPARTTQVNHIQTPTSPTPHVGQQSGNNGGGGGRAMNNDQLQRLRGTL